MKNKIIIIAGPTATGKTDLAIKLAKTLDTEIISADSRLIYKDFNIGTAKPSLEELAEVKHHMIDIAEPSFKYTVALFKQEANLVIDKLFKNNKIPIIVGGTGFYIRSIIDNLSIPEVEPDENLRNELKQLASLRGNEYIHNKLKEIDPITANKLHFNDIYRIIRALEVYNKTGQPMSALQSKSKTNFNINYYALTTENRDILYKRINQRVLTMIESGLIEEVKFLIEKYGKTLSLLKTLGYKEVIEFFENQSSYQQMIEDIQKNTRHFARRQLIWFRPDKRINWYFIDKTQPEKILNNILLNINTAKKEHDR